MHAMVMRAVVVSALCSAAVLLLMITWDALFAGCTFSGGSPPSINGRYMLTRPGVYTHDVFAAAQQRQVPTAWRTSESRTARPVQHFVALLQRDIKPAPAAPIPAIDCSFTFACQSLVQQIRAHWSVVKVAEQQLSDRQLEGVALYHTASESTAPDSAPPHTGWKSHFPSASTAQFQCFRPSPLAAAIHKLHQMPRGSLLFQACNTPVSLAVIAFNCAVFVYLKHRGYGYEDVGCSFERVVAGQEWGRVITSSVSHFELFHIGFNMMSVYQLRSIEVQLGSIQFVNITSLLMLLPQVVTLTIFALLIRQGQEQHRYSCSVGYSGVVFGWMTIVTQRVASYCPLPFGGEHLCFSTHQLPLPNGQHMPFNIAPFVSLGFVQLILPRAAFHGHLGGILVGYLVAWGLYWDVGLGSVTPALMAKGVVLVGLLSVGAVRSDAQEISSSHQPSRHVCVLKGLGGLNLCLAAAMAYYNFSWTHWVSQLMSGGLNYLAWQRITYTSNLALNVVTFCAAVDLCVTCVDFVFLIQNWPELVTTTHQCLLCGLCVLVVALATHAYTVWATHGMYRSRTTLDPTDYDSQFLWAAQAHVTVVPFSAHGRTLAEV